MIKKLASGKHQLFTRDGSKPLGPPTTRKQAEKQERAIQISKARAAGHKIPKR